MIDRVANLKMVLNKRYDAIYEARRKIELYEAIKALLTNTQPVVDIEVEFAETDSKNTDTRSIGYELEAHLKAQLPQFVRPFLLKRLEEVGNEIESLKLD